MVPSNRGMTVTRALYFFLTTAADFRRLTSRLPISSSMLRRRWCWCIVDWAIYHRNGLPIPLIWREVHWSSRIWELGIRSRWRLYSSIPPVCRIYLSPIYPIVLVTRDGLRPSMTSAVLSGNIEAVYTSEIPWKMGESLWFLCSTSDLPSR